MSSSDITGDLDALEAAIAHLDSLGGAVERAAKKAAPEIQEIARANYANNKGPGGVAWPRNKDGTYPSLARPAALVTFRGDGAGIRGSAEEVLEYHQEGNPRLPKRAVFPDRPELPPEWQEPVEEALRAEVEKKL